MDEKKELTLQFREQQQKYVYYNIALSVASIGFSVYQTMDASLSLLQIPLGLSILCWAVGVFCGLRFLKYNISILFSNIEYFKLIYGEIPGIGMHPGKIEAAKTGLKQGLVRVSKATVNLFNMMEYSFYSGIIFFIIWRILEMHQLSVIQ